MNRLCTTLASVPTLNASQSNRALLVSCGILSLFNCRLRRWYGVSRGGSTRPLYSAARTFQPFSEKEERELVHVLTTKPRHVARYIRQSVMQATKNISHFRNSVTYLMIVLQSKLQQQQIAPEEAALVVQGIMHECVLARQSDMAHLLFRAALRFRKYGLNVTAECVSILFQSYVGSQARELMENLAKELRNDPKMRPVVLTSYIYAGQTAKALELKKELPLTELTTEDFCALISGFGAFHRYGDIIGLVREAFEVQDTVDLPAIASAGVIATRGDVEMMNDLFRSSMESGLVLSDSAIATVARARLMEAKTLDEVYKIEEGLRKDLGTDNLGIGAETAILSFCANLVARRRGVDDRVMLQKLSHLEETVSTLEDPDPEYVFSLLRGYGVLGHTEEMNALFDRVKATLMGVGSRFYDEVLRWNARAENVKEVIRYKEEMEENDVRHSTMTYVHIFNCLDRFYPRMVEKYYNEMLAKGLPVEARIYPVLLRVFADSGDYAMVDQLYAEMRIKSRQGQEIFTPLGVKVLLHVYRDDEERCYDVIGQAGNRGLLDSDVVKHALMRFYSKIGKNAEFDSVVGTIITKTELTYRLLLRHYSSHNERGKFESTLKELRDSGMQISEQTLRVMLNAYSRWGESARVRNILAECKNGFGGVVSSSFYADVAAAFARVGDMSSMDGIWDDLVASKLPITMSVFNKLLDLYMSVNNLDKVQLILHYMMETVPANPVTATTIVDMLGKMGRLSEMQALLEEMMKSKNAAPTAVTYHQAMSAYAKVGDVVNVEEIRDRMRKAGMTETAVTYNILVEAYGRAKRFEHIVDIIQERHAKGIKMDEFGYIGLINTYGRARMADEINDVVASLVGSDIPLNARLLSVIATAYSYTGDTKQMEKYIQQLLGHPSKRQRDVEAVFMIYSRMRDTRRLEELLLTYQRTEFVYNICIATFAKCGDYMRVATLLHEMEAKDMVLQRNTSIALSSLLLKAGKVELAQAVLNWKRQKPVTENQLPTEAEVEAAEKSNDEEEIFKHLEKEEPAEPADGDDSD